MEIRIPKEVLDYIDKYINSIVSVKYIDTDDGIVFEIIRSRGIIKYFNRDGEECCLCKICAVERQLTITYEDDELCDECRRAVEESFEIACKGKD